MNKLHSLLCALLLNFSLNGSSAQRPDGFAINLANDPALQKPISMRYERLSLGATLKALSQKAGVRLTIDSHSTVSGIPLMMDLKEMPVGKLMEIIPSLVGTKSNPWRWSYFMDERGGTFRLSPPKRRNFLHRLLQI